MKVRAFGPTQAPGFRDWVSSFDVSFHPFSVAPQDNSPDDVVRCSMRVAARSTATPLPE
jgi:hypothetical protein